MKAVLSTVLIHLVAAEDAGGPTQGFIIDLNATEMKKAMALNKQYQKEFDSGEYVSTAEVSWSMTKCSQACSKWCWAASATMAASAFGGGSDCTMNEVKLANTDCTSPHPCNCDEGLPNICKPECNFGGGGDAVSNGIALLAPGAPAYINGWGALSNADLDNALGYGPVIVGVTWSDAGGHAITIGGVSGGKYQIHDPAWGGEDHSVDYAGVLTYQPNWRKDTGKWAGTTYTDKKPEVVV